LLQISQFFYYEEVILLRVTIGRRIRWHYTEWTVCCWKKRGARYARS